MAPNLTHNILDIFNSFHSKIIYDETGGDKLNFFDVTIIKQQFFRIFNWYHKLTFSNFFSYHVISISCLLSLEKKKNINNRYGR